MKRRLDVTMNIESILKKPFVDEHDVTKRHAYVRNANAKLSEKGLLLKKKADAIIRHDKNVRLLAEKHAQVKKALQNHNGSVGASDLISKFAYLYENHKGFKDELVVCLLDAVMSKITGHTNIALAPMAANFFTALHSTSGKGFDIVSANLWGPSKRAMQSRNAALVTKPFICYDNASVFSRLAEILQVLGGQSREHAFSVSIDATKVPPVKQLAPTYSSVIGGCYPQHFVAVDDTTTAEQARAMLSDPAILKPAQEVKVAVLTFQYAPRGICPTFILCGRPQTTNEVNDFNEVVIKSCAEFCSMRRSVKLVSCAVDGVSSDSEFVRSSICQFFDGIINHPAQTDTNHNHKNLKYQVFSGGSCCSGIGNYVFDQGLLPLSGIPVELYRSGDFASDLLVLRLASFNTIDCLCTLALTEDPATVSVMCLGLYFSRLNLLLSTRN
jgi:hypothetical protein